MAILKGEDGSLGQVVDGEGGFIRFVVALQDLGEIGVGGGTGLDVMEMPLQGLDHIVGEDFRLHIGDEQLRKGLFPFLTVRLQSPMGIVHIDPIMSQFMHEGDEHLIGVEVGVQGDNADPMGSSRGAEVAEFGVARTFDLQLETRIRIRFGHHGDGLGGEVTLQDLKLFNFHDTKIHIFNKKVVPLRSFKKTAIMAVPFIPTLLLTGYLGSGKTTLVNRILNNRRGIKFAVIVNDIGEVNIDADLIEQGGVVGQGDDSLMALQNGCICCTLKMDLVKQLSEITAMKRFDYIVIEASGICEPEPIAQTICTYPRMGREYYKDGLAHLDCIVTVVDALRLQDEFSCGENLVGKQLKEDDLESLVIQQIEFCNIILLNKASEVSDSERGRIKQIIRALQPKAEIIECDYCDVDMDKILNTKKFDFDDVAGSAAWIQGVEGRHEVIDDDDEEDEDDHDHHHDDHDDDDDHEEGHHHHHHHEHEGGEVEEYGIGTFVYYRRRPFNLSRFDEFVARKLPRNVIRVKGICWFKGEEEVCYIFEQAGKQVQLRNAGAWFATMPKDELREMMARDEGLRNDWDNTYGDRMQKLVFIGQKMDEKALTEALDACLTV